LYHAYQTPKLEIVGIETENFQGLVAVTATIMNTRIIPTHSQHDVKQIERPNYISLTGSTVVVGMTVQNEEI
jgi:hypothetical protein